MPELPNPIWKTRESVGDAATERQKCRQPLFWRFVLRTTPSGGASSAWPPRTGSRRNIYLEFYLEAVINAKRAKKLRWFARAQEAAMPDIMVNKQGIPSTLLVYDHKKIVTDRNGKEHEIVKRTIQYNPRTSGKGYYRALKAANIRLRGNLPLIRQTCQFRAIKALTEKQQRAGDIARSDAEALAVAAAGMGQQGPPPAGAEGSV
jgi:hypothetical protein